MPAVVNAVSAVGGRLPAYAGDILSGVVRELRRFGLVIGELTGRTIAYVS